METENDTETASNASTRDESGVDDRRLVRPSVGERVFLGGGMHQYEVRVAQMIVKERLGKAWTEATPEERRHAIDQGKKWKRVFFGTNETSSATGGAQPASKS